MKGPSIKIPDTPIPRPLRGPVRLLPYNSNPETAAEFAKGAAKRTVAAGANWLRACVTGLTTLFYAASALFAATNPAREDEIFKLSPPRAELPPTFWEQYGSWVVIGACLVFLLVGLALWWVLRPRPFIPVPIEIQTRKELEALRQLKEDGQVLSQVSRVLRRYVACTFALSPDEMTTSEFCQLAARQEKIGTELAANVNDFLRRCDELKFAPTNSPQPIGAAARALELVELGEARCAHLRKLEGAANAAQPTTGA